MKCPNCATKIESEKTGEAGVFEEEKRYAMHLKIKHKNVCFFCERIGHEKKGTALVEGYLLCTEHAMFIQRNSAENIRRQFGQDINVEVLKEKINMEPI